MAFLGTHELKTLLPQWVSDYDSNRIDIVAYELSLGDEVYVTDSSNRKKEKLDVKNSQVVIKPGQFALLLTKEKLTLPNNILGFISIKFSKKIKGLVNVSGFHVDPGFKGKLIFSVYNAGPSEIILDQNKPCFLIWFSQLTSPSEVYRGKRSEQSEISAEDINNLSGELASPNVLLKRIKGNEILLRNLIWASGILMTLGLGLTIKYVNDSSKFNEGYNIGVKERQAKEQINQVFNAKNIDSILTIKIDSIAKQNNSR